MDPYQTTFHTWNKVAGLYQERFMDLYNDTYDRFCQRLPEVGPAVLEIGCGPGNITRYLLAQRPDFRLTGLDIAPNMVALAQANNPAAEFRVLDCRDLDRLLERYGAIMCGFCLPYLAQKDGAKLLCDCARLLQEPGIAYFSAIEGDYAQSGYQTSSTGDQIYLYYYSEKQLRAALRAAGFAVLEVVRKLYPPGSLAPATHLILTVRKQ